MRLAVSRSGKQIEKCSIVPTPKRFEDGLRVLRAFVEGLDGKKRITAVAGAIAGSFDRRKSIIIGGGSNIKDWVGRPLKNQLEKIFKAPVYLENDAALAGLAEAMRGAGRGREIVAYLTWSTGIGGARIVKGKIDANARGFEPHHQIIDADGSHLGTHISGRALEEHFGKKPEFVADSKIWDKLAWRFATMLNNTIVYWSPDIIVLGGSVMKSISLSKLRRHLKKIYGRGSLLLPPPAVGAKLGDLGGLWGALELLKQKLR